MRVIIDSREQAPYRFTEDGYSDVVAETGALSIGDYSLAGLETVVAVERKSLPDLVMCLGRERDRFHRELLRAAALDAFCVVVESNWFDLASGRYRSGLNPKAAVMSVSAFSARYKIPFMFAGDRAGAELAVYGFLKMYLQGIQKRWKTLATAQGVP